MRRDPNRPFGSSRPGVSGSTPGQEAIQFLAVEFPAEALRTQRLGEIRLELAYIPSPYRTETVNALVSIGQARRPEHWFPLEAVPSEAQSFDGSYFVP